MDDTMANKKSAGKEQLTARVDAGLQEEMHRITPKAMSIGHVWSVAARILLSLPPDMRHDIITGRLPPSGWTDVVLGIVQKEVARQIEAGKIAAATPPKGRSRTPRPKACGP